MYFLWHANQTRNVVVAGVLDHIDTRMSVATGADQDQTGFAHEATGARPELLGILIKRCESDWAPARSMRGQSLNAGSSCISIQTGRVMRPASLVACNKTSR